MNFHRWYEMWEKRVGRRQAQKSIAGFYVNLRPALEGDAQSYRKTPLSLII